MEALQPGLAVAAAVLFLLLATAAWASSVFQLPGNWLMILFALLYGWYEGFRAMSWWVFALGGAAVLLGEALEWLAGWHGARRFGGSRWAGLAALLGSVVGALVGAAFAWGLGAIPGTLGGAFLGALTAEVAARKEPGGAMRVGLGAALGRALGLAGKLGFGAAFLTLLYLRVIWTALSS